MSLLPYYTQALLLLLLFNDAVCKYILSKRNIFAYVFKNVQKTYCLWLYSSNYSFYFSKVNGIINLVITKGDYEQ